ncbi:MAG TPA: hypothetical protein V6D26_24065 [Stenomitos sp.]
MQANGFIKQTPLGEIKFNQATHSEAQANQTQPDGFILPSMVMFDHPFYAVLGWVIFSLMMSAIFTVIRSEIFSLEPISQVPCRNCQFFSSNPYLQCAVHPGMALTDKAINCSDYCPQKRKLFH